eukprot:156312_1
MGGSQAKTSTKSCNTQTKTSYDKTSNPLRTYPDLLKMGFHWALAREAAKRYPDDISAAVNWITLQQNKNLLKNASRNNNSRHKSAQNIEKNKAENVVFKISVGIDFGTDGLGLAYSIKDSDGNTKVYVHDNWKTKNFGRTSKPKAIILLNEMGDVCKTGLDAKHIYNSFDGDERHTYLLFDRFKMALYKEQLGDEKESYNNVRLFINNELTAINGKKYSSEKIFIKVFQHVGKISMKYLKKQ